MFRDQKVKFRREELLAEYAAKARRLTGLDKYQQLPIEPFFNGIKRFLIRERNVDLSIEFGDLDPKITTPAFISFSRPSANEPRKAIIRMHKETWLHARLGDPLSIFIVVHEIAHAILHEHESLAFSDDSAKWISFDEESAEWQANTFTYHALVPLDAISSFGNVDDVARSFGVLRETAHEQFRKVLDAERRKGKITDGQLCERCGDFSMYIDQGRLKCRNCDDR